MASKGFRKDSQVSSRHFVLLGDEDSLFIEDLDSTNGTWLNGRRLVPGKRYSVDDQAVIRVGNTAFVVCRDLPWRPGDERDLGLLRLEPPLGRMVAPLGLRELRNQLQLARDWLKREVEKASMERRRYKGRFWLIEGETGTGKELLAEQLKQVFFDARGVSKFGVLNMAALPKDLADSILFGYVKGAFSGADKDKRGVFEEHSPGVVFLDEIGDLPLELQPKLLRLIENGQVQRVGKNTPTSVLVDLLAATNRGLRRMVDEGTFREDLYARADRVFELPPLRSRRQDLLEILWWIADDQGVALDRNRVPVESIERIVLHRWPMNVRELKRFILEAVLKNPREPLAWKVVKQLLPDPGATGETVEAKDEERPTAVERTQLTAEDLERALRQSHGNLAQAARSLHKSRQQLYRLLDKFDLRGVLSQFRDE